MAFPAPDHDVAHDRVSEAPDRDALDDDSGDGDQKPDSPAVEAPRGSCSAQPCDLTYTLNLTECLASMGISFNPGETRKFLFGGNTPAGAEPGGGGAGQPIAFKFE